MDLTKIIENKVMQGTSYIETFTFDCGNSVPIYDIHDIFGLNQLIGYAKFINNKYGRIFYRGECHLHNSIIPSIFRRVTSTKKHKRLLSLIKIIRNDKGLSKELNLNEWGVSEAELIIESMLQHYGAQTRFIDVVDNHWIALWMGQNRFVKKNNGYATYEPRDFGYYENIQVIIEAKKALEKKNLKSYFKNLECINLSELYQYIILLAIPYENEVSKGFYKSESFDQIDLRQTLPSIFLRPHAQHGLLIKKKGGDNGNPLFYDLSSQVVCILRMRVDRVRSWLGEGNLISQKNLFPSPAFDLGYNILLSRNDLFKEDGFKIIKYFD